MKGKEGGTEGQRDGGEVDKSCENTHEASVNWQK